MQKFIIVFHSFIFSEIFRCGHRRFSWGCATIFFFVLNFFYFNFQIKTFLNSFIMMLSCCFYFGGMIYLAVYSLNHEILMIFKLIADKKKIECRQVYNAKVNK
jgi:hypothetical protein